MSIMGFSRGTQPRGHISGIAQYNKGSSVVAIVVQLIALRTKGPENMGHTSYHISYGMWTIKP